MIKKRNLWGKIRFYVFGCNAYLQTLSGVFENQNKKVNEAISLFWSLSIIYMILFKI
jgi:hypothetical protein